MAGVAKYLRMAGAVGYVNAARYAVHIGTTRVTGFAAWSGPAGNFRQHAPEGCYKPTVCSSINAKFDTVSIADSACGVARQTDPAWVGVRSVELYPVAGSEQHSDIAKVMYSTHPGQYQLT